MYSIKWQFHKNNSPDSLFSAWLLDDGDWLTVGWGSTKRDALDMLASKVNRAMEEERSARIKQLRFIVNAKI